MTEDGRRIVNQEKHLREAQIDDGEFDEPPRGLNDPEYDDYYAKIRAQVGYDDDAFESDESCGNFLDSN